MGGIIRKKAKYDFIENNYLKIRQSDPYSFTEGDVETKIITPILNQIFCINNEYISSKPYMKYSTPSFDIDKGAKKKSGYIPDFIVYVNGLPLLVIEAKSPTQNVDEAMQEASLYALELNKKYESGINPVKYVVGCNGIDFLFSEWDSESYRTIKVNDISPVNKDIISLNELIGIDALKIIAEQINQKLNLQKTYFSPMNLKGGIKRFLTSIEPNPFFGTGIFSNIISQYFDSGEENRDVIIENAYVSTADRIDYDRELEAILKNRIKLFNDNRSKFKTDEEVGNALNKYIDYHIRTSRNTAKLQLVIGPVGSGKSLFMERFYKKILTENLKQQIIWVNLNFNNLPDTKEILEDKVSKAFIDEIRYSSYEQGIDVDENIEAVFNGKINENKSIYKKLKKVSEADYLIQLKQDLFTWKNDLHLYVSCLAGYLSAQQKTIVIVFDNVDRLEAETQIKLFQVAQWLINQTRSLGIMDIRDTTYEMFKDRPPLDAFVNGNNFYINSPSIIKVINKRLELAAKEIKELSKETELKAILDSGKSVIYDLENLEHYFNSIYSLISNGNGKRIINSLSNRSIRKVLRVFSQIIRSGHINVEKFIVSAFDRYQNFQEAKVSESELIKAIMRENHKYYNTNSNLIHNIWGSVEHLEKNSSFIMLECLLFLSRNFNKEGDKKLKGIFYCKTIVKLLEKYGFTANDVMKTLKLLLEKDLIYSEKAISESLELDDLVQISSSGHLHLKFLSSRLEYISSCAYTSLIRDKEIAERIADIWSLVGDAKDIKKSSKQEAARLLMESIEKECNDFIDANPYFSLESGEVMKLIQAAKDGIEWMPETYRAKSLKQDIVNNEDLGPELMGLTEPSMGETNIADSY